MDLNDEYVLSEAGCLNRGCEIQVHDLVSKPVVELVHVDKTGARSTVSFEVYMFKRAKLLKNPYTGQHLQPWAPDFIRWAHEFHEVADKMARALA